MSLTLGAIAAFNDDDEDDDDDAAAAAADDDDDDDDDEEEFRDCCFVAAGSAGLRTANEALSFSAATSKKVSLELAKTSI